MIKKRRYVEFVERHKLKMLCGKFGIFATFILLIVVMGCDKNTEQGNYVTSTNTTTAPKPDPEYVGWYEADLGYRIHVMPDGTADMGYLVRGDKASSCKYTVKGTVLTTVCPDNSRWLGGTHNLEFRNSGTSAKNDDRLIVLNRDSEYSPSEFIRFE